MYREREERYRRWKRRNLIIKALAKSAAALNGYITEQEEAEESDHPYIEDRVVSEAIDRLYELLNYAGAENEELLLNKAMTSLDTPEDDEPKIRFICTLEDIKKSTFDLTKTRQKVEQSL